MKILITGGNGQLGKELRGKIPSALFLTRDVVDLTKENEVQQIFKLHKPDVVIHTAALAGNMVDQIKKPAEYLSDNVKMNTFIVDNSLNYGVKKLIAITSTGVYPNMEKYPITEKNLHDGPPTSGFFSYSIAKRTMAVHVDSIKKQYGFDYCHLAVGNMYGIYDNFGKSSHFIASMMKKIYQAKLENKDHITLYGTGKPLRQFINASDVALVIKKMIEKNIYKNFNLTDDKNISVEGMAKIILKSLSCENMYIKYDKNKPDGQYRKDVSIEKFRQYFPDFCFKNIKLGIKEMYERNF